MKRKIVLVLGCAMITIGLFGCGRKEAQNLSGDTEKITNESIALYEEAPLFDEEAPLDEDETIDKNEIMQSSMDQEQIGVQATEETLRELLQNSLTDEDGAILDFVYDDFDMDGFCEAFGFTGTSEAGDEYMPELHTGKLWYVTENGAEVILDEERSFISGFKIMDFGNRKYLGLNEYYVTARVTYLYSVRDGKVYEDMTSRLGDIADPENGETTILISAYDGMYDPEMDTCLGHSWKPYYFYYDEKEDCIVEYGGEEISSEEVKDICGFDLLSEIENTGFTIGTIFYRPNGILNVNYTWESDSKEIHYHNANYDSAKKIFLDVWQEGENTWQSSDFGGTYLNRIS